MIPADRDNHFRRDPRDLNHIVESRKKHFCIQNITEENKALLAFKTVTFQNGS